MRSLRQRLAGRAGARVLVVVDEQRLALLLRHLDRNDLLLEDPLRDGALGLLLALSREVVLLLARDAVVLGDVLGGDAHVDVLEGVHQPVMHHRVDHLRVAHARAEATAGHQVGRPRHVLHAAGHDDVRVARPDDLRRQRDGLQARAAEHVDGRRGHLDRQPGSDRGLARGVLAEAGLQHAPEQDLLDLLGRDLSPARAPP